MWSYYGTKKAIAEYYPKPMCNIIIEPFCGAAQYSLFGDNWQKKVLLIDRYDVIIDLWNYLIQAKESDILSLPEMNYGDKIDNHTQLCKEEKYLIGFSINSGSAQPKKTVKKFNSWPRTKLYIASNLYKIRHWEAKIGAFYSAPDIDATWYIDPPYQFGGEYYRYSNKNIDYGYLSSWCQKRKGQVIVCENTKAEWLPFSPLVKMNGQLHETMEAIWYKQTFDLTQSI